MADQFEKKDITKKSQDISRWYTDVVLKAELADYGPVKGTMVIRPYGYAIWERVQEIFNSLIKPYGVENAYFPLFIPYSLLEKEKTHVKGFSPELAIVTHGGGKKLKEPLVVRPTSETIMYEMYRKWIHSWRDLPMLINQWNNVVRWEKRTYPFLRTTEFLWQEGHTAHETEKEAIEMAEKALEWYRQIYEEYFALPVILGTKSNAERFAGAKTTYAVEPLMPDGKVLQGATSHNLGQNFSKVFDINFQDKNGKNKFVWQTSWGLSTRSLGGLFLAHGDDDGLILPPQMAPIKLVIIPILGEKDDQVMTLTSKVKKSIKETKSIFPGKVEIWRGEKKTLGWKLNEREIKGIPLAIIIGPGEVNKQKIMLMPRFGKTEGSSYINSSQNIGKEVEKALLRMQNQLLEKARLFLEQNTHATDSYEEFKQIMKTKRGFIKAFWCGEAECETKIKEETKATTRALSKEDEAKTGKCIYCHNHARELWYFAQAY